MGLFSFIKTAGAKLFGGKKAAKDNSAEEAAAENARRAHKLKIFAERFAENVGIENVDVSVNGEMVTVFGIAKSQADREKMVLALGNVEGVATVDDRIQVDVEEAAAQFHTVERGDSLSKIAKHYYGNPMKYPEIFEANKPMLEHPDKIYPGQVLRIPNLDA